MSAINALPPCTVETAARVESGDEWHQQHPTWVYQAIMAGAVQVAGEAAGSIAVYDVGAIAIPDGHLVACDPYAFGPGVAPFTVEVLPGQHRVLAAVTSTDDARTRTAAVLTVFESQPITRWALGRTTEETVAGPFEMGEIVGYNVGSGVGCFASPQTLPALSEVLQADAGAFADPVSSALRTDPVGCVVTAPRPDADAVAVFRTGQGEGVYATWFGHGADGTTVLAMTEFALFDDPWGPERDRSG